MAWYPQGKGGGGGGGSCTPTPITWAALVALLDGGLAKACKYLITDFQTVHIILGVTNGVSSVSNIHTGSTEPLVVIPTSPSTLELTAYSPSYPDDEIEYQIIDTSSANPNDGSSKGRITLRKNTVQNLSTGYDFRNVVFYHPQTTAISFAGAVFPVVLNNITENGTVTPIASAPLYTLAQVGLYLQAFIGSVPAIVLTYGSDSLTILSKDGTEYTDIQYTDSTPTPTTTGTLSTDEYYTFGNSLYFGYTPTFAPAADGNQIGNSDDIYIKPCTDAVNGQVQNNIIIGAQGEGNQSAMVLIDQECVNGFIGDSCNNIYWDQYCNNIVIRNYTDFIYIAQYCSVIDIGVENNTMMFEQRCNNIFIGGTKSGLTGGNRLFIFEQECFNISITGANNFSLNFGNYCNNISLYGNDSRFWNLGDSCHNIHVNEDSSHLWEFGSNCNNINISGYHNYGLLFCPRVSVVTIYGHDNGDIKVGTDSTEISIVGNANTLYRFDDFTNGVVITGNSNANLVLEVNNIGTAFYGNELTDYIISFGDGVSTTFNFTLNIAPSVESVAGTIAITDGVEVFTDNGDGTLTGSLGGVGVMNYETGVGSVTFNTAPANAADITLADIIIPPSTPPTLFNGESVGTGNGVSQTFALAIMNPTIQAGTLTVTDGVETFADNGDGTLTGSLGGTGVINYNTGVGSVTFNTAPANLTPITANYGEVYTAKPFYCFQIYVFPNNSLIFTYNINVSIEMYVGVGGVTLPPNQSNKRCAAGYSNWEATIDVSGLTTIDLFSYPVERWIHLKTTNASENINSILNAGRLFPVTLDLATPSASYIASDISIRDNSVGGGNIYIDFKDQTMSDIAGSPVIIAAGVFTLQGASVSLRDSIQLERLSATDELRSVNAQNYLE